jgi:hypothetical protein
MRPCLAAVALLLAVTTPVQSGPVTVAFAGHVTRTASDQGALAPVGSAVSGTFTYDSSLPNLDGDNPTNGSYDNADGAFHMTIGTHTLTYYRSAAHTFFEIRTVTAAAGQPPGYGVNLQVNYPLLDGHPLVFSGLDPLRRISIGFEDTDGRLPSGGPDLPPTWDTTLFDVRRGSDPGIGTLLIFSIDTLAVVPEPGGLTLAGVCLAGLAARGWRKRG